MKILGFSAQKPLYQAWQQDLVLLRTWETETYPAIRAEAKRDGATIYLLWRRVDPHGRPRRHDVGAPGPDAGGAGDGPALLAEHDLGSQHVG